MLSSIYTNKALFDNRILFLSVKMDINTFINTFVLWYKLKEVIKLVQ